MQKLLDFLDGKGALQFEVPEGAYGAPSAGDDHPEEPRAKRARLEGESRRLKFIECNEMLS
jgi:hypothetical protein